MADDDVEHSLQRLARLERALDAQRVYIQRVPDPDNRYRAETNLLTLLELRDATYEAHRELLRKHGGEG